MTLNTTVTNIMYFELTTGMTTIIIMQVDFCNKCDTHDCEPCINICGVTQYHCNQHNVL